MQQLRLLIAEEQEILRRAYGYLLASEPDVEEVGMLASAEGVRDVLPTLSPHVVLVGTDVSPERAIEEAAFLRTHYPELGVVLLSGSTDTGYVRDFFRSVPALSPGKQTGGRAYLLRHKLDTVAELMRVIRAVAEGQVILDPLFVEMLTKQPSPPSEAIQQRFTRREMEVFRLMAQGLKNGPIARVLSIEPKTVEHHINNIFAKLRAAPNSDLDIRVHAVLTYLKGTGRLRPKPVSRALPSPKTPALVA